MKNILDEYAWHCVRGGRKQIQNLLDLGFIFPAAYRYDIGNICESKEKRLSISGQSSVFKAAVREILRREKERAAPAREMYGKLLRKVGLRQEWAGTALECADVLAGDHWNVFLAYNSIPEFDACDKAVLGFDVRDLEKLGARYRAFDLITEYKRVLDWYPESDVKSQSKMAKMIEEDLYTVAASNTFKSDEYKLADDPQEVVCNFPVPTDLAISLLINGREVRWRP